MSRTDWQDFPIVAAADAPSSSCETVELIESGYGALVAWEAGPPHVRRIPQQHGAGGPVRVTVEKPGRSPVSWDEKRTPEDVDSITSDINGFLAEAGIPARPTGYRWLLDLPPSAPSAAEFGPC